VIGLSLTPLLRARRHSERTRGQRALNPLRQVDIHIPYGSGTFNLTIGDTNAALGVNITAASAHPVLAASDVLLSIGAVNIDFQARCQGWWWGWGGGGGVACAILPDPPCRAARGTGC
jgi:hypothetical protein